MKKLVKWLSQYNKAFVPAIMTVIYFLNSYYGIELPIGETEVIILLGTITSFLTWLIPNGKAE